MLFAAPVGQDATAVWYCTFCWSAFLVLLCSYREAEGWETEDECSLQTAHEPGWRRPEQAGWVQLDDRSGEAGSPRWGVGSGARLSAPKSWLPASLCLGCPVCKLDCSEDNTCHVLRTLVELQQGRAH